ncbi:nuclear factor 7, brain-like isoform X1 [Mobula hypostoma]|uniref:nuclear factor 7, brain-like isoform X1 n=1 Tax=Mobula hypostoma TaxID=723540 RepID=UPI002FC2F0A7
MASKEQVESLTEEVICPICLDFFTEPVSLECGHYFCRSCITRCWEREERNFCPECREEFADRSLTVNRVLANLSEKVRKLNLNPKEKESKLRCEEHEEELKLFCETDKTLICLICRDALEHKSHNFMPIKEAVKIYKDRVKSSLDSLTKKKSDFQEMKQEQKEKIAGVREQSQSVQSHITSQFAEPRRIITEKEQHALRDLREEEERILNPMEKNLQVIQENLNSIQEEISKLQEQMDQQDNIIFLMMLGPKQHSQHAGGTQQVGQHPWKRSVDVSGRNLSSGLKREGVVSSPSEEARRKRRISDNSRALSVRGGALLVEKFDHPYLLDIVSEEVIDSIKQGPDRVYPRTMWEAQEESMEPILETCVSPIAVGEGSEDWRETSVEHLLKIGWREKPGKYRPSLSPWMWKRRVRGSRCLRIGRV